MKRILVIILSFLLLCGCSQKESDVVSERLGTDTSDFQVIKYSDTHGGFHGDGETVIIMTLTERQEVQLLEETNNHFCRFDLPFSENISTVLYGGSLEQGGDTWYHNPLFQNEMGEPLLPEITSGFYLFYDRSSKSTDPSNDSNLYSRHSWNFDLAVYDADTRTLYFLALDT